MKTTDSCRNLSFSGGGEGNRTPVQKPIPSGISERRHLFAFPCADVKCQTSAFGSFQFVTQEEAALRSCAPLNDALAEPWSSPVGRQPLIRLQEQRYCCQLILKLRILKRFRTAARCRTFTIPVETFTPPYIKVRGKK